MKGRILVIISLFVVFAVTSAQEEGEGQKEGGGKCYCDIFWSRTPRPNRNSVTFEIGELEVDGVEGEGDNLDCDRAAESCLERCEARLEEEFQAKNLAHDRSFKLGKMLCELEQVGIPYYAPRHINMKTIVHGCDVFRSISLGDLCCFNCYDDGWKIFYNRGCRTEPTYPIMRPGIECEL